MNCLNCSKKISAKSKYCSDKCRMAYTRRTKAGNLPEQTDPEHATRTFDFELTRTDQLFEKHKPNYYTFDQHVYTEDCLALNCGKVFKSHLRLLRFCSPEHMVKTLDQLSGAGR